MFIIANMPTSTLYKDIEDNNTHTMATAFDIFLGPHPLSLSLSLVLFYILVNAYILSSWG